MKDFWGRKVQEKKRERPKLPGQDDLIRFFKLAPITLASAAALPFMDQKQWNKEVGKFWCGEIEKEWLRDENKKLKKKLAELDEDID